MSDDVLILTEKPNVHLPCAQPLGEILYTSLQVEEWDDKAAMALAAIEKHNEALIALVEVLARKGLLDIEDIRAIVVRGDRRLILHEIIADATPGPRR